MDVAISVTAGDWIYGSLVRSVRQGLPVIPRTHSLRPRRMVRGWFRSERREAFLLAGGAHRFPAGSHSRRTGFGRRPDGNGFVWCFDMEGIRDRQSVGPHGTLLLRIGGARIGLVAWSPDFHKYGREYGRAANQRFDFAATVIRRQRHRCELLCACRSTSSGLRKQKNDDGLFALSKKMIAGVKGSILFQA